MNTVHSIYKRETGREVTETEFGVVRRRGVYVLDPHEVNDEIVFNHFGHNFFVRFPDIAYIEWMEEKLNEILNQ
jgi:hypothetical protein